MDWTKRTRQPAIALCTAIALALAWSAAAQADSYQHRTCAAGGGPTEGWTFTEFDADAANACLNGGAMTGVITPPAPGNTGYSEVSWSYMAPAGLQPRTARVRWGFRGDPSRMTVIRERLHEPPRAPEWLSQCTFAIPCEESDPTLDYIQVSGPPVANPGRGLRLTLACLHPNGSGMQLCDERSSGTLTIAQSDITLWDDNLPSAGAFSGSLTNAGPLRGTVNLLGTATDGGGGVRRIVARADGAQFFEQVETNDGRCVPVDGAGIYLHQVPCPRRAPFEVEGDTRQLTDGQHVVSVEVTDVGQNAATVWERTITVDNVAAPANVVAPGWASGTPFLAPRVGDVLTVDPGQWRGDALSLSGGFRRCPAGGGACTTIRSGTDARYTVTADDVGFRIAAEVTASNSEGSSTLYVAPTGVVRAAL